MEQSVATVRVYPVNKKLPDSNQPKFNSKNIVVTESYYYKISRTILWFQFAMGRNPYSIRSGRMEYRICSMSFCYSLLMLCAYVFLTVTYRSEITGHWDQLRKGITFNNILFSSVFMLQLPGIFLLVISWIVEAPKIVECYNEAVILETNFANILTIDVWKKGKIYALYFLSGMYYLASTIVCGILIFVNFPGETASLFFAFILNFLFNESHVLMWCLNFVYIKYQSIFLQKQMNEWIYSNRISPTRVAQCRKIWLSLWRLTHKFESAFPLTIAVVLIVHGTTFITACYGVILSIDDRSEVSETVMIMPYLFTSFLHVFGIIECAHQAMKQLSCGCLKIISNLNIDLLDRDTIEMIDIFVETIHKARPQITLSDYIVVNRALLISFLSYAITYLIVLLQFQANEHKPKCLTNVTAEEEGKLFGLL